MRKLTNQQFLDRANAVHHNKYEYLSLYVSAKIPMDILCNEHGIFSQTPDSHLQGSGCPKCSNIEVVLKSKSNLLDFSAKSIKVHGNKYEIIGPYINAKTPINIKCLIHGLFKQTPNAHLAGKGCQDCGRITIGLKKRSSTSVFIDKAKIVNGDNMFDYSQVDYVNNTTKVKIICLNCNQLFEQQPNNHLNGQGCPFCGGKIVWTTKEFIFEAIKIHGYLYDYSLVDYINSRTKVKIGCKKCNCVFQQTPSSHIHQRAGCFNCAAKDNGFALRKLQGQFIIEAIAIFQNRYNYDQVIYINSSSKVKIVCNVCNTGFKILPNNHLQGKGCPKCSIGVSKPEIEWLNLLNIPIESRQCKIKINSQLYWVDGFDPITNTIYEFYGDYWHGNPAVFDQNKIDIKTGKTFGELYHKTLNKERDFIDAGYKIVSIWESEWNKIVKQGADK